jgi:hypothetical protein
MNIAQARQLGAAPAAADPSAEEVAAALVAIAALLAEEQAPPAERQPAQASWRGAARLEAHGLHMGRTPAAPTWGNVERLRRAGGGITGL